MSGLFSALSLCVLSNLPVSQSPTKEGQEAKRDCAKSGISVKYEISYVSYRDLVLECEP
eukprot:COSAG02_NODE_71082_length_192_cov_75.397849_1_plen_58_part_01